MIGDRPDGTMKHYVDKNVKCKGYEAYGTIVITYSFNNGVKNGR